MTKKKLVWTIILVVAVGMTVIPRLFTGYGADGDAARGVKSAQELFDTGKYIPSRLPGNPLFEYMTALVVPWGGYIGSNLFVFLFFILSVIAFSFLVKERNENLLMTGVFALTPVLLVNAATTMDYTVGLAFILYSYVYAKKHRHVLAGILIGFSIGCRLSNALFVIPLILYFLLSQLKTKKIIIFFLLSASIGLLFYIPVFLRAGFAMFEIPYSTLAGNMKVYVMSTVYKATALFGPLATAAIFIILLMSSKNIMKLVKQNFQGKSASFILEVTTIILFIALFIRHSDEMEYLIPVIPFFYLLISRWLTKRQLIVISILVISTAIFNIEFKGGESGQREIVFKPTWGYVIKDYTDRSEIELLRSNIGNFNLSNKAIILTGMGVQLTYENRSLANVNYRDISPKLKEKGILEISNVCKITGRDVYLVYGLSRGNVDLMRKEGYEIFTFSELAPSIAINEFGYNPYNIGIKKLDVMNSRAFYKKGV